MDLASLSIFSVMLGNVHMWTGSEKEWGCLDKHWHRWCDYGHRSSCWGEQIRQFLQSVYSFEIGFFLKMCALVAGTESNSRSAYGVDWYNDFIVRFIPLEYLGTYIQQEWLYLSPMALPLYRTCFGPYLPQQLHTAETRRTFAEAAQQ